MLKPKRSFQSVVGELVQGLRSGEITLQEQPGGVVVQTPVVERTIFQKSSRVYFTAAMVSFSKVQWSGRVASPNAH